MTNYSCILVDDEPLAIDKLSRFLEKEGSFTVKAKCHNALEAEKFLSKNYVDLCFFDIQMPGISGVEFARTYNITQPVIFTTAYEKYALESFELNVLDYLLKPYSYERFQLACAKAKKALDLLRLSQEDKRFIFINSEHQIIKVALKDILYVEGLKDYVKIFTSNKVKPILTRQNLKKMETLLPKDSFLRVHRSYIVSLDKLRSIASHEVEVASVRIPLGEMFKEELSRSFYKK